MADSTLGAIRTKVRRLTRSPSVAQLTDTEIDEYVNTFILYDLPEHLRLFKLRSTFTFYTDPNIEEYASNSTVGDPLENFDNKYIGVYGPAFVAGYESMFTQSLAELSRIFPFTNSIVHIRTGDGVQVAYTGTLQNTPFLRNHVTFGSVDTNGNGIAVYDDGTGTLDGDGIGTINYTTGAYSILFTNPPGDGEEINSITVPYTAARPNSILFFDNKFIVRPVPDKVYPIQVEVDIRPTELLSGAQSPDLEQWWQYIAYGAAKKVFEDRTDMDSIQLIMPEFTKQEILVNRRTINLQTKERTATIYTESSTGQYNAGYGSGNF